MKLHNIEIENGLIAQIATFSTTVVIVDSELFS